MSSDRKDEPELCLPLPLALEGYRRWSNRRRSLLAQDATPDLIPHAVQTVPYYSSLSRHSHLSPQAFPLIDRAEVTRLHREFLSTSFVEDQSRYWKPTSGTTNGRPLIVHYDLAGFYDINYATYSAVAEVIPGLASTIEIGRLGIALVTNHPLTYRASTVLPSLKFAVLRRWSLGRGEDEDRALLNELRTVAPPLLCGTPSYLMQLCALDKNVEPEKGYISSSAVLACGDTLHEDTRARLEDWFGCPVFNSYTSSEGGLMAMECMSRRGLHIRNDRVRLEILNHDGSILEEGCGEILLTNWTNWAMPFIHYRTGDFGTIGQGSCDCGFTGPSILDLPGRTATLFSTQSGDEFDPRVLDERLGHLPIRDFQVRQLNLGHLLITWVPLTRDVPRDNVEQAVSQVIGSIVPEIRLSFETVTRIAEPGKKVRRYVQYGGLTRED